MASTATPRSIAEPRGSRRARPRPHAKTGDDDVGMKRRAARQRHVTPIPRDRRVLEVEHDAVFLVQPPDGRAHVRPQNPLHRDPLGRHDMDFDPARPQGRRRLESDEACAEHDHAPRRLRPLDDGPGIRERPEHEHIRKPGPLDGRAHRFGARRHEKTVVPDPVAACENNLPRGRGDADDL